jgi:hypothetical protein
MSEVTMACNEVLEGLGVWEFAGVRLLQREAGR